jgi:hypothetical protein
MLLPTVSMALRATSRPLSPIDISDIAYDLVSTRPPPSFIWGSVKRSSGLAMGAVFALATGAHLLTMMPFLIAASVMGLIAMAVVRAARRTIERPHGRARVIRVPGGAYRDRSASADEHSHERRG